MEESGEFHFKGVYAGQIIKKINLMVSLSQKIVLNEDYILHVEVHRIENECLWGKLIKSKALSECFMKD